MRRCSEVVEAARPISSTISQPIQVRRRSSVSTTFTRAGWPSALARAAIRSRSKATVAFADGAAGFRADFTAMRYILRYSSNDAYNNGDRKRCGEGKGVSVGVSIGGGRRIKKKK